MQMRAMLMIISAYPVRSGRAAIRASLHAQPCNSLAAILGQDLAHAPDSRAGSAATGLARTSGNAAMTPMTPARLIFTDAGAALTAEHGMEATVSALTAEHGMEATVSALTAEHGMEATVSALPAPHLLAAIV